MSIFENISNKLFIKKLESKSIERVNLKKIYPYIKWVGGGNDKEEEESFEWHSDFGTVSIPWRRLSRDLGVFYLTDRKKAYQYITTDMLPPDMDERKLFDIARDNFARDFRLKFKIITLEFGGVGLFLNGNLESCSLLYNIIWEYCAKQFNSDLIITVPSRDVVIAVPFGDSEKLKKMKERAREVLDMGDHTLTPSLIKYDMNTKELSYLDETVYD